MKQLMQNKKQVNLLVVYWCVKSLLHMCVTSFMFGCYTHKELWGKFMAVQVDP